MTDSNKTTRDYLDSILVEERLIGSVYPDITTTIFGEEFAAPIMTPAFSHLKPYGEGRKSPLVEYSEAAARLNILNWVGMEPDELVKEMIDTGAKTVRIIKPYADQAEIVRQMNFAEDNGAFAVGVDIDHIFGSHGTYDVVDGQMMGPITLEDLKGLVAETGLPFVAKGVLSVSDAVACAAAGVDGIVVSHHHGIMPSAVPPLMVLPDIVEALAGTGVEIFVDCHIDTADDVFKCLALGANAAAIGRSMIPGLQKDGADGVVEFVTDLMNRLKKQMGMTGAASVADIDPSVLWMP